MKFQNPTMHSLKVLLCIKKCAIKNAQIYKRPLLKKYFSEFIQKLTRSSTHHYQSITQVSRL